ncbi:MAG: universal stress protein [Salaquimonas sp.]
MAYTEILVHLDYTKSCDERINAALSLAERSKARVKGVAFALESTISSYLGIPIAAGLDDKQRDAIRKAAEDLVAGFKEQAKAAGVEFTWEIIECGATKAAARLAFSAKHADISIMGQPDPDSQSAAFIESLYEGVLFGSGRPVYLVPYYGRIKTDFRKAIIAWDGSKKAARAVRDAIPLLKNRGKVIVLVINPKKRSGAHGDKPGQDIATYLSGHGIDCKVDIIENNDLGTDTLILNHLVDAGADLLVMGAYGHSRLREKAFGGVTNSIVHQMTAPVLMSE